MALSSQSTRIFDAQDPVMTTDLELLAKVNTFKQSKFDAGAEAVQNEINNWGQLAQIAKPELREYANAKISNLVNNINSVGGIDLSDSNNVNYLKGQGFQIYGDKVIMDGIATTRNMQTLQKSINDNLTGKNAKDYDPIVGEYLMRGYQQWANDGNPNNTRYDGPTALPVGNMAMVNAKVDKVLDELKPDLDSAPVGPLDQAAYVQVKGKWLSKDRVNAAVNATLDANDMRIFTAHGWKSTSGLNDSQLKQIDGLRFDKEINGIKGQLAVAQASLNSTSDASQKIALREQIANLKSVLADNESRKQEMMETPQFSQDQRDSLSAALYKGAWQDGIVNSRAYREQTQELKSNTGAQFVMKENRLGKQWAAEQGLRQANFELKKRLAEWKMSQAQAQLPGAVPLTQETKTGTTNEQKNPKEFMNNLQDQYFSLQTDYNAQLYNLLGSVDTQNRFNFQNGEYTPKPEFRSQINLETTLLNDQIGRYSDLTDSEKASLHLPTSPEELSQLFALKSAANTAGAYYDLARQKENDVFQYGMQTGVLQSDFRQDKVTLNVNGAPQEMTVDEALSFYRRLPEGSQAKKDLRKQKIADYRPLGVEQNLGLPSRIAQGITEVFNPNYTMEDLLKHTNEIYQNLSKSYVKQGGKLYNSYSVPLTLEKLPEVAKSNIRTQLQTAGGLAQDGIDIESIKPIKGYIELDAGGKPHYIVETQYGTGKKISNAKVDVTEDVRNNPNTGVGAWFPKSDLSLVYGLYLSKDGSTPFDSGNNYENALRTTFGNYPFKASAIKNSSQLDGMTGLKLQIAVPIGGGKTEVINVKNMLRPDQGTTFPLDIDAAKTYLDNWFSTPALKQQFYQIHGLEMPK